MDDLTTLTSDSPIENSSQPETTLPTETIETAVDPVIQQDTVPLATFLELKKNYKEAKGQLADYEDSKHSDEVNAKKQNIRNKWIDKGFDEDTATAISEEIAGIYEELNKARKSEADVLLSEEINDLSKDSFYSDIKQHEGAIKSKIRQFAKAGEKISIEDAYLLIAGPRTKMKEQQIKSEAISSATSGTQPQANVPTATGSSPQNIYNLDSDDKAALAKLKEMQPTFNWDEKKYFETVKRS